MFKKMSILILLMFFTVFSNDSFVFAEINDLKVDENNEVVEIYGSHPELKPTDWGTVMARSSYTHTSSGGIRQYTNTGNRSSAMSDFTKVGGNGEVTTYVNGTKITHVKQTPAGHVTLYTSSSTTLGEVRPTLNHALDKIRYLGD